MKRKAEETTVFRGALETYFQRFNPLDTRDFENTFDAYKRMYGYLMPSDQNAGILDLGCGAGHFLYFLVRMGYRNHLGVDRSEEFVTFIRERITKNAVKRDIFDFLDEEHKPFDLVVMNDFLEHVQKRRLQSLLRAVGRICADGGKVFIKTINMTFPLSTRSRYVDFTHEVGFTEESLRYILELSGFADVRFFPAEPSGLNSILRLLMWPLLRLAGQRIPRIVTPNIIAVASPSSA